MTQVMAVELAESGTRVNAFRRRSRHRLARASAYGPDPGRVALLGALMKRYGKPSEIAGMAVFLLDHAKAGFVTGQTGVDGARWPPASWADRRGLLADGRNFLALWISTPPGRHIQRGR